jgi:hypothetical protein
MERGTGIRLRRSLGGRERFSPLQLSDLDTTLLSSQVIAIIPSSISELRTLNHNLWELYPRGSVNVIDEDVDPGTKAKHQRRVCAIKNQITACQKDLAWCRDGCRHLQLMLGSSIWAVGEKGVLLSLKFRTMCPEALNSPIKERRKIRLRSLLRPVNAA